MTISDSYTSMLKNETFTNSVLIFRHNVLFSCPEYKVYIKTMCNKHSSPLIKKGFNSEIITALKSHSYAGSSLTKWLMDTLDLGKEATYRRLRGEVPFSFSEAATIAKKLNLSLDRLVGTRDRSPSVFDLYVYSSDPIENHLQIYTEYLNIFNKVVNEEGDSHVNLAVNTIPFLFSLPYDNISKFRVLRWKYQIEKAVDLTTFSDIVVPEKVKEVRRILHNKSLQISSSTFILDPNVFSSFIREVKYFKELHLISETEVQDIKEELHDLIRNLELYAINGKNSAGKKVRIYVSSVDIEACYAYIQGNNVEQTQLRIYSINSILSRNHHVCEMQKKWIDSLKRYSVLISQSGEIHRKAYFNEQRKIIDRL